MNNNEIQKFLDSQEQDACIKISFKKRNPLFGKFIKQSDFSHLSEKNFWRIVTSNHFTEWDKSNSSSLPKIFNGADFLKLTSYQGSFED